MQRHRKPVEVTNVKWAEIVVEGVIQKSIVDGEVDRLKTARVHNSTLATLVRGPGDMGWDVLRSSLVGVRDSGRWKRRGRSRRGSVGSEIETICYSIC